MACCEGKLLLSVAKGDGETADFFVVFLLVLTLLRLDFRPDGAEVFALVEV